MGSRAKSTARGVADPSRAGDRMLTRMLPLVPRPLVRRFAAPYIAGATLDSALDVVRSLRDQGLVTTIDVLGEAISSETLARETAEEYVRALEQLAREGEPELVNVSLKLTALGLTVDRDLAYENLLLVVRRAQELGGFVRIDMEDSPYTTVTLELYRRLRAEGLDAVGIVLQAYLRRSVDDLRSLLELKPRVRVVKGIYREPATIAFANPRLVNRNYLRLCELLASNGCHGAYATHDDELVAETQRLVEREGLTARDYEYQMLLGVKEELRTRIAAQGHTMRVYVPYGAHWHAYSMRRLQENPEIAGYIASDILRSTRNRLLRRRPAQHA